MVLGTRVLGVRVAWSLESSAAVILNGKRGRCFAEIQIKDYGMTLLAQSLPGIGNQELSTEASHIQAYENAGVICICHGQLKVPAAGDSTVDIRDQSCSSGVVVVRPAKVDSLDERYYHQHVYIHCLNLFK